MSLLIIVPFQLFKFGLIAIIATRFLCDLIPLITSSLLVYMVSFSGEHSSIFLLIALKV